MSSQLEVGAASRVLPIPLGTEMGGYAARTGNLSGVRDELRARVVTFVQGDVQLAVVVLELLYATRDLVSAIRHGAMASLGIPPEHVMVCAIHTHSGPASLNRRRPDNLVDDLAAAAVGALEDARRSHRPVLLKQATVPIDGIGANRRGVDRPVGRSVRVVVAEAIEEPMPVAVMFGYPCHATVLEADNLQLSADFPGSAARQIEDGVGGTAVYLQGCAGDVNPVWMEHTFREVDRLGGILAGAVTSVVRRMAPLGRDQRVVELRLLRDVPVAAGAGTLVSNVGLRGTSTTLELPQVPKRQPQEYAAELSGLEEEFAAAHDEERDRMAPRLAELRMHRHMNEQAVAATWMDGIAGEPHQEVEVQALRFGDGCGIVSLPGEPFVTASNQIRQRLDLPGLLVAGYANGAPGYFPTNDEYARGGYEVGTTLFPPGTSERLVDAAVGIAIAAGLGGEDRAAGG
jgi:neutral ceramidase